jgi:catechol 2,3-dioxygenase-like lactoylglutathione lyase family enzyme
MAAFTNTEFEFGGIHHLALTCSDMQRTVDFYTNILGMKLVKTLEFTHESGSGPAERTNTAINSTLSPSRLCGSVKAGVPC